MDKNDVVLVIGAGDALGGAIARRFAREGMTVCLTRRNKEKLGPLLDQIREQGGQAEGFGSDARDEAQVVELISHIEAEIGPIAFTAFNIGGNVRFSITETTARVYRKVWEMGCFAGFLTGRESARVMLERGRGTIVFTGATASVRGGEGYAAFSGAKHALRALSQSMARELGPKGIHVAHVVINGAIDTPWIKQYFPEQYALKDQDGILNPDSIAENYWRLHTQPRDSWTHELDLRPWMEAF